MSKLNPIIDRFPWMENLVSKADIKANYHIQEYPNGGSNHWLYDDYSGNQVMIGGAGNDRFTDMKQSNFDIMAGLGGNDSFEIDNRRLNNNGDILIDGGAGHDSLHITTRWSFTEHDMGHHIVQLTSTHDDQVITVKNVEDIAW